MCGWSGSNSDNLGGGSRPPSSSRGALRPKLAGNQIGNSVVEMRGGQVRRGKHVLLQYDRHEIGLATWIFLLMRERVFGFLRFAPAQIKEADVGAPAAIGRNSILSRPSWCRARLAPPTLPRSAYGPNFLLEGERLDPGGRQLTERRVFASFLDDAFISRIRRSRCTAPNAARLRCRKPPRRRPPSCRSVRPMLRLRPDRISGVP
jgi:hypothetical protein